MGTSSPHSRKRIPYSSSHRSLNASSLNRSQKPLPFPPLLTAARESPTPPLTDRRTPPLFTDRRNHSPSLLSNSRKKLPTPPLLSSKKSLLASPTSRRDRLTSPLQDRKSPFPSLIAELSPCLLTAAGNFHVSSPASLHAVLSPHSHQKLHAYPASSQPQQASTPLYSRSPSTTISPLHSTATPNNFSTIGEPTLQPSPLWTHNSPQILLPLGFLHAYTAISPNHCCLKPKNPSFRDRNPQLSLPHSIFSLYRTLLPFAAHFAASPFQ